MIRRWFKRACLGVAIFLTAPCWLPERVLNRLTRSERFFVTCAQVLSLVPGLVGVFLRRAFYLMTLKNCGPDVFIEFGTYLSHRSASIGNRVYIGARCTIGMCTIGDSTLIGSNVDILSGRRQHGMAMGPTDYCEQPQSFVPVAIGRNTWLGNSSTILADIGDNTIVGAGSVLVHPAPADVLVAGNPAQVKRVHCSSEN